MTQQQTPTDYEVDVRSNRTSTSPPSQSSSAWAGWVVFAGVMLLLIGAINVIDGLVALFNDEWFVVGENALLTFDFTTWGWALLILGGIQVASGFGVMTGNVAARTVGVVVAGVNLLAQLAFISAYPAWSMLAIALDVIVIFALTAHGRDVAND